MVYHSRTLDHTFSALADPTRRAILSRLARGDQSISALASRFDMSLPAVSKHVRVLLRAGLAKVEKEGRVRRATLSTVPMRGALEWIEKYRRFWESELDLLAAYLESQSPPEPSCPDEPKRYHQSRSAKPSVHHGRKSSTHGRRPKS